MSEASAGQRRRYHHGDLRHALIEAAVGLARENGPEAIVLREAARRVGVTPTAAYRHFSALPDLVAEVAAIASTTLADSMEDEVARCRPSGDSGQDAWNEMRAVGRGYIHFALHEPGLFTTAFTTAKRAAGDPPGTGRSGLSPRGLLERSLDRLVATGMLAEADRQAASVTAWAVVHGLSILLLDRMIGLPPAARDTLIEATLDMIGSGLLSRD